ncbi:MAG: response regulator [Flavobacteriales bacterium]|nr:response regulator [Flavobacteriales bacterium]
MNKAEILVVDDEPAIRKLLRITLESNGYTVREADNGRDGLLMAANHPPDLVLLDIGLADRSGHDVLKDLRGWYTKAVIVLSVRDGEGDIVGALDNGASDYVTKPFRTGELLARIRSAMRWSATDGGSSTIISGDLHIDLAARSLKRDGRAVKLTATEFNLLAVLARNEGRVLTHRYLLKEVWGVGYQEETQYLRVFVRALRKKIEVDPERPMHITTESGVGYRFV